ncbi:hypothetical protein Tco_0965741 [Tanacetum coccineum]
MQNTFPYVIRTPESEETDGTYAADQNNYALEPEQAVPIKGRDECLLLLSQEFCKLLFKHSMASDANKFHLIFPLYEQHVHQEKQRMNNLYFLLHPFPTSLAVPLAESILPKIISTFCEGKDGWHERGLSRLWIPLDRSETNNLSSLVKV